MMAIMSLRYRRRRIRATENWTRNSDAVVQTSGVLTAVFVFLLGSGSLLVFDVRTSSSIRRGLLHRVDDEGDLGANTAASNSSRRWRPATPRRSAASLPDP